MGQERAQAVKEEKRVVRELTASFGPEAITAEQAADGVPTVWVSRHKALDVLRFLKSEAKEPYRMLYDITAVDERVRSEAHGLPRDDFTVLYHLLSLERNEDIRVKVPLGEDRLSVGTAVGLWPNADWYEREVWDMFGISFDGHPDLRRILMPAGWKGHPLRKDHPARATEMEPYELPEEKEAMEFRKLEFRPEDWGLRRRREDTEYLFLNLGPQHPGTHGLLRIILELDGEFIVNAVPDIGFHHRGAEKMGERQSWHTYIPYTDRIDYLGGVLNNLPYVLAVEKLAGIEVPERAKVIRVLVSELFRLASHLVWYGTFAQDLGAMSPVFYTFNDREVIFRIVEAVTGGRMHPGWFRIGGVAEDLPRGWEKLVRDLIRYLPRRLREYDRIVMQNSILKARTKGIGRYAAEEAVQWGVTGPGLRATGVEWDFRKKRPYSGYDWFEFDIPTAEGGDSYDRAVVRVQEMRQSLRIVQQCLMNMPSGPYKAEHPASTPPLKEKTMVHIETLIDHFLNVSWGPVVPAGEAFQAVEASKGSNGYYLISDGDTMPYRVHIRTPSFAHMQMVPAISRGLMIQDLLAILGSVDFILADIDK
ncbi:MAG: NADH-quinone oxidoreductase subunit C/D [Nitrospirota bacterium]|jgi:NADH-quinone oxidoreductase subunit C/D